MIKIKRNGLALIALILIILVASFIKAYPTNLEEIYGANIEITSSVAMDIGHAPSINEPMLYKTVSNTQNIEGAINYLSNYKFILIPSFSFKKFSSLEAYQLNLRNDNGELLNACIRGNKYLFISDESGNVKAYKTLSKDFDLNYFESLYKCGS